MQRCLPFCGPRVESAVLNPTALKSATFPRTIKRTSAVPKTGYICDHAASVRISEGQTDVRCSDTGDYRHIYLVRTPARLVNEGAVWAVCGGLRN